MEHTASDKQKVNIEDEMRKSYLDYAMSVIVGRALPDARDGLKPVHRRCLFSMHELNNDYDKPYKKSARVVGDVIGKYHPHGDTAVYDTMVRMAQDFSLRYPLIDGQGNFGSIDGDAPAAMRYTEIRMKKLSHELLADMEKETVDFRPNYDDSLQEPVVFPCSFPNLLVNGSSGIAVGMATNIPPHNLGEIIDAVVECVVNPDVSVDRLLELVPGPDFPTGGFIVGRDGIRKAYETGRGIVRMRARYFLERSPRGRVCIVFNEIPYQVNKQTQVQKIAELVQEKKLEGIADIRDESDREGMRIVVELKKDENPQRIVKRLFKDTSLESSFGIIMLAVVDGEPRVFGLKEAIGYFLSHRQEVVVRRTVFDLRKAEARAHILEGLLRCLDQLDLVIKLIREAKNRDGAKKSLKTHIGLTDIQADAVLDIRLYRLTALEMDKISSEYREIQALILRLRAILDSPQEVKKVIVAELKLLKQQYSDRRRTEIVDAEPAPARGSKEEVCEPAPTMLEQSVISLSPDGYVKRSPLSVFLSQERNATQSTPDRVSDLMTRNICSGAEGSLTLFCGAGKAYTLRTADIPDIGRTVRGKRLQELVPGLEERVIGVVLPGNEAAGVVFVSRGGTVKRTLQSEFGKIRSGGVVACLADESDPLLVAIPVGAEGEVALFTKLGKSIRFPLTDLRPMGRAARGVCGIKLEAGDEVVSACYIAPSDAVSALLSITTSGLGKKSAIAEFPLQSRGGKGVVAHKLTDKTGSVLTVINLAGIPVVYLEGEEGIVLLQQQQLETSGRATSGQKLPLPKGFSIVSAGTMVATPESLDLAE